MLEKASTLNGYKLRSLDGDIGSVRDFYFDDRYWTVRYLVAETGSWLTGRQVLISPYALKDVISERHEISVDLTRKQIEDSPPLESAAPVSREFEDSYFGFFGWPMYWNGPYPWGAYPEIARDREQWKVAVPRAQAWSAHLRSTNKISGHHIHASDGEIGHVADFLIDADSWAIRYLIVDTRNWWSGKKILLAPDWIERTSWDESTVHVGLTREEIKQSPAYPAESPLTRDYETRLHGDYGRSGYWVDDVATAHSR